MSVTYRDTSVTYRSTTVTYRGTTPPTTPVLYVDVAFTNNPGDSSLTWVDISDYVRSFSTRRGRNTELDRTEAGVATIMLSNDDQRFDPNNTAGPYYGYLKPMRRVRIRARWNGTTYPIFSGLVKAWPQEYPDGVDAVVPLECVDLFRSLNLNQLSASYVSQLSGTRVAAVLTSAGWPTGADHRDIDAGQATLQASTLTNESALSHLQEVAASEPGLFFMSRDGKATFIDRHSLLLTTLDTALTWGEDAGEYGYTDVQFLDGDTVLWNNIDVTADALATQSASDATSQAENFPRKYTIPTLLASTSDMLDRANYAVSRYKTPATRVARLHVQGNNVDSTTWTAILAREIGDKIRVRRTPPGGGDAIQQDSVIEGIEFNANPGDWRVAWSLSPMENGADYWVLDDATQSVLDSTTRLAF